MNDQNLPADPPIPPLDPMMMDLFKVELAEQLLVLNSGLLEIERKGALFQEFEPLMRAAHSIKGAGRIVNMEALIRLSHVIEDTFVEAQKKHMDFSQDLIDILLYALDLLSHLEQLPQRAMHHWLKQNEAEWDSVCLDIQKGMKGEPISKRIKSEAASTSFDSHLSGGDSTSRQTRAQDRVLRVTAQNINRLMGLAGESLVESRWLEPFYHSLLAVKPLYYRLDKCLDSLTESVSSEEDKERSCQHVNEAKLLVEDCKNHLARSVTDLDAFMIRNSQLSDRLYGEVIASRMRPFKDCLEGFQRMVRDLAKELGKRIRLEIFGQNIPVDRDILEKLEASLGHLLRNAVDHGIETPEQRVLAGKNPEGVITLEAEHRAGALLVTVKDDGRGVDLKALRQSVVERHLIKENDAQGLSEPELLEFLALPGFSTAKALTDISGRGVGLSAARTMVQEVGGVFSIKQQQGEGTCFSLQLPLTLSVIRALIVRVAGDPYAFSLARIDRVLKVPKIDLETVEGRQFFLCGDSNIGIISAKDLLELSAEDEWGSGDSNDPDRLSIVVFSDRDSTYGLVVDKFVGERELVVYELDSKLKKIPDVYAAGLMEDGSPIIILDIEDIVCSIGKLLRAGRLKELSEDSEPVAIKEMKKILIVDDSITVREVEARLLRNRGYHVETAVNGVDGWNALRMGSFDLVVTDVDMPRMNGIELVKAIRNDARLKDLPVMIVSYKEQEGDQVLGLDAGANYYLKKSSFYDEALLNAVIDLIGK